MIEVRGGRWQRTFSSRVCFSDIRRSHSRLYLGPGNGLEKGCRWEISYFFLVGSLVEELDDLLGKFVVSLGPDATSLVYFDHSVFANKLIIFLSFKPSGY